MNLGYITLAITMSNQAKGNLHYEMILTEDDVSVDRQKRDTYLIMS